MVISLSLISLCFAVAWVQQQFLNRLITTDLEQLQGLQAPPRPQAPHSQPQ